MMWVSSKKRLVAFSVGLGCLAMVAGWWWFSGRNTEPAYNPDNLIRLHVIANSDTDEDQRLKRQVRDAILAEVGEKFAGLNRVEDAQAAVLQALPQIEQVGRTEVETAGKGYDVRAVFGVFPFPTRSYGEMTLPGGEYQALRVVIGEGKGENWWCVLFPPLCFVDIAAYAGHLPGAEKVAPVMTKEDPAVPGWSEREIELRFKVLEVWRRNRQHLVTGPGQGKI